MVHLASPYSTQLIKHAEGSQCCFASSLLQSLKTMAVGLTGAGVFTV